MNAKTLTIIATFLSNPAYTQGFAGLGSTADGFAVPDPNTQLTFPKDHGAHPEFRIEWWYLTATLGDEQQNPYGVQWTLFRLATSTDDGEGWNTPHIWMGHAAATSETDHVFAERIARGGIGQAGVESAPFVAWIDHWQLAESDETGSYSLHASSAGFSYDLNLLETGPLVLQGQEGYSIKSADGQASHYYSQPHFDAKGHIQFGDKRIPVQGNAWYDREWSSQPLSADQTGWDWFSLRFDTGAKLMGFVLRGEKENFTSGTWISPSGEPTPLAPGAFTAQPLHIHDAEGREIPTHWQVELPEKDLSVEVKALNPNAWMGTNFSYWEGPVTVTGSHNGAGYLEMTGYE
ncbi:lipocalin-like domain-containing protein [Epibacterium ulvae]|uniref:lipocalin-like domain-containing protein n=1 Tax=Epibacterium ulvae TaxID=1156985 RepID=UPI0024939515|nr:lipocalin-like domain-containing protein [Epibacterium ulvae]